MYAASASDDLVLIKDSYRFKRCSQLQPGDFIRDIGRPLSLRPYP